MGRRLFIISNRLPVTVDEVKGVQVSSGGLVTAIKSFVEKNKAELFSKIYWVGIPGCSATVWHETIDKYPSHDFTYIPVFPNANEYEGYYNGHANSVLWPLFHYFPSYAEYNIENYQHYKTINLQFLHTILKYLQPGDTIWVHDYHLLLFSNMLRQEVSKLTIGFFLHIPFPSYEIFRLMPRQWQEETLSGMLGADLLGFHTIDYASHFLQCVQMVIGLEHDQHVIRNKDRISKVDVFPISIDYDLFNDSYNNPAVISSRKSLIERSGDQKIIFSVDRLDYTKGVNNRLKAYEYFLLHNPEYQEKVVFILVVVPSRDQIQRYVDRKKLIDETISSINSQIGSIRWQPVIYQYSSIDFEEMIALYTGCDLALITPLRDGMNLVAKEFVASRNDEKGVLVLSEMAGVARELTDALIINPNDIVEIANKIKQGLEMPLEEQKQRMETMRARVADYNVSVWTNDFFFELEQIKKKQNDFKVKFLDDYSLRQLLEAYHYAKNRLLLLDYDGTLVSFESTPDAATPDAKVIDLLKNLAEEGNEVYVISGRHSAWLESWFGDIGVNLIAEHGARYKNRGEDWTSEILSRADWKEDAKKLMQAYVRRCANSFTEEKEYSLVWHYRRAHPEQGKLRASELYSELSDFAYNRNLQVMKGNKIVEVRNRGIDKGTAITRVIGRREYDFVLAIGDDATDEDMFKVLVEKKEAYTIKVGSDASFARYNLYTSQMVLSLLDRIAHIRMKDIIL